MIVLWMFLLCARTSCGRWMHTQVPRCPMPRARRGAALKTRTNKYNSGLCEVVCSTLSTWSYIYSPTLTLSILICAGFLHQIREPRRVQDAFILGTAVAQVLIQINGAQDHRPAGVVLFQTIAILTSNYTSGRALDVRWVRELCRSGRCTASHSTRTLPTAAWRALKMLMNLPVPERLRRMQCSHVHKISDVLPPYQESVQALELDQSEYACLHVYLTMSTRCELQVCRCSVRTLYTFLITEYMY